MVTTHAPSEEGELDWRRLATERNVSHAVARALWEHARLIADSPVQAERAYNEMLDEAEAANATHEPGRGTLVDAAPGGSDVSSLGPGKWTRVLLAEPKPRIAPPKRTTENAAPTSGTATAKPSVEDLRSKLAAAGQAGKQAAELLASSDAATIVGALLEMRGQGPEVFQKIMNVAGGAIERILGHRASSAQATGASEAATGATDSAPAGATAAPAATAAVPTATAAAPAAQQGLDDDLALKRRRANREQPASPTDPDDPETEQDPAE